MANMRAIPTSGASSPSTAGGFVPPLITQVEDTGLSPLWLQDLALKILYFQGYLTGFRVSEELALPFNGVTDLIMESLKREKFVEVKSSPQMGLGEGSYQYAITGAGIARAREALERSQYAGPAPVPLEDYNDSILQQSKSRPMIDDRLLRKELDHLVLAERTLQCYRSRRQFGHINFPLWTSGKWQDQHRPLNRRYDPAREYVHPLCALY